MTILLDRIRTPTLLILHTTWYILTLTFIREPLFPHGLLAQLVEQGPLKPKVLGSIPRQPTSYKRMSIYFTFTF
jgi:hypothetical protein